VTGSAPSFPTLRRSGRRWRTKPQLTWATATAGVQATERQTSHAREKLASANEIVDELLEAVVTDLPFAAGDDVALMVNEPGGTPISELYLLYGYARELLAQRGINVRRNYVGNYCTSLDMAGTSITLSRLDPEIEELLAAPAEIAIRTF
jgi:dihydroxyacetone kinase-like protein